MTSRRYGAPAPEGCFVISTPTIDHLVRASYCQLLSQPVPDRLLQLIRQHHSQDKPPLGKGVPHDGSED
jgi:hypothetical protein